MATMATVEVHADAGSFLAQTEATLARDEAGNSLILGVPISIRDQHALDKPENVFITMEDGARLLGAAVMRPPYNLIIHVEEDAIDQRDEIFTLLSTTLQERGISIPGIIGRTPHSGAFAEHWARLTGAACMKTMSERIFILREVIPPLGAGGHLRRATMKDMPVATRYFTDFLRESMPDDPNPDVEERMASAIGSGRLYFWALEGEKGADERIVCMVGTSRDLPNGRSIGPVYTPPEERCKGYASNATAALSQRILDEGYLYCTLFTDVSNPTANHIYQELGFKPVCDYEMYAFTAVQKATS